MYNRNYNDTYQRNYNRRYDGGSGNSYSGNNNYSRGGYNNGGNRQRKKKSGARSGTYNSKANSNVPYVSGWMVGRQGFVSIFCKPTDNTKQSQSKTGRTWENWMVTITPSWGAKYNISGMYDVQTGRIIIEERGIVINPRANNGGYCGRFGGKNRRN